MYAAYCLRSMSRILIAEDEPRLSSFLEKGLRAAGYNTTVVDDGVRAATRRPSARNSAVQASW